MVVLVNGCGHEVMTVHITDCAKQGNNKISSSVVQVWNEIQQGTTDAFGWHLASSPQGHWYHE